MTMIEACTVETPIGPLAILSDNEVVIAAGFTTPQAMWERVNPARRSEMSIRDELGKTSRLMIDYFDGQLDALGRIAVDQPGTELQHQIWDGLRAIPAGETRTYTELAAMTDNPGAVRAAGTACGRNLIAPIVACHRALRSDGSLGGYYYGLDVKRRLLDHEAKAAA